MDTASFQFVAFGLAAVAVSNLSRSRRWRSTVLLMASIVFMGLLAPNPILFIPLAGFLLLGYAALVPLQRGWIRSFSSGLGATLLAYVWLKKYTFIPEALFLRSPYFTLGLSYIFFRVLHLLMESRETAPRQRIGLGAYLCYTLNFTTLVSGPIQRYEDFARSQFAVEPIPLSPSVIGLQLERIVRGFFKVNVLGMLFELIQENALAQLSQALPMDIKYLAAFQLAIIYPLFLYANFSGYIDIVIALARLMRLELPENFDRPFSASSFLDFWNRWHITLSTWLKTYVYNPLLLSLMRRIPSPSVAPMLGVISFFFTFFLVGVWHGRTSEFVVFGILQGGGVAINKLWQLGMTRVRGRKGYKALTSNGVYTACGRGLTFAWFALTLFWFWARWAQIDAIYNAFSARQWLTVWAAIWVSATVVLAFWECLRSALLSITTAEGPFLTSRYSRVVFATALGMAAFTTTELLSLAAPGLVYKAF